MADVSSESPGLRELKKLRTRAVLVDAAMDLCLKQGYQHTTVEQIAASADVSPRTFSRYFPTKDAVFLVGFSATIVDACGDLISDTDTVRLGPMIMVHRLNEALAQVAGMASERRRPSAGADYERAHG